MKGIWDKLFGIDDERTIWVTPDELGKEKVLLHRKNQYLVKIPKNINRRVLIRLKGLGKKRKAKNGDLFLHVWLNKGEDVNQNIWLSESDAMNGSEKIVWVGGRHLQIKIPPKSHHGRVIRFKGLGREFDPDRRVPNLKPISGNLLVKLVVFPDKIMPNYGAFENLSTDDMALEGWVYRKFDEVTQKIEKNTFPVRPITPDDIAGTYNKQGWYGILNALIEHLNLKNLHIVAVKSDSIALPGCCERTEIRRDAGTVESYYKITIKEQLLDNPFMISAIFAHELCHVIYNEKLRDQSEKANYYIQIQKATVEEERTVDLLVFMHKIGEYQLRVARDKHLTIGYFHQEIFERMQVFVSKKLDAY